MTAVALTKWYGVAGATAVVAAVVAAVFAAVPAEYALAGAVLIAATAAVYRLPVISLSLLIVVGIGPMVLSQTGILWMSTIMSVGRVSLADVIMTAMLLALGLRAVAWLAESRGPSVGLPTALALSMALLCAWIVVSVLRNVNAYGIHTIGQFRHTYLILVVAAYAAVFLRSPVQRRRMVVVLLVMSVGATLAAVPLIGHLKGWGTGPNSRFLPANVVLGLLYGWTALLLVSERGLVGVPKWLARGLALPVAAMILVDSHRSVWLSGLLLLAYFVVAGRVPVGAFIRVGALAVAVVAWVLVAASIVHPGAFDSVPLRASAIVNPAGDPTSSWRLGLWESNLARWRQHPFAGDGFGGYYVGNATRDVASTLTPHNFYVETLVSMGAIGLLLFLASVATAGALMWTVMRRQRRRHFQSLDATLVEFGLGVLFSALAYIAVYPFDYYPALWVGVGLSAALGLRRGGRASQS